nr:uncharacterized protein LOC109180232 [Ipomoea batatas]GME08230.1 uncharacterized protein LOC109180232 [Ipomoea batatas]GME20740.1 uncharacterized protein LOC109180232 [Ipomoea batatas]
MARYCNISAPIFIIALFITTALPIADSNHSGGSQMCGGAAECTAAPGDDGGEEFLMMDSQSSASWILDSLQGSPPKIIYGGLQKGSQCNAKRSGSCFSDAVNHNGNVCKDFHSRSCFSQKG